MNIRVTPAGLQDLKDIRKYISDELKNPSAAERTIRRIISDYLRLTSAPLIGQKLGAKLDTDTPFCFLVSGNYLIFYAVNNDTIEINRIIYGRRDYAKLFFNKELFGKDDISEGPQE